jgi:hypothetical protein
MQRICLVLFTVLFGLALPFTVVAFPDSLKAEKNVVDEDDFEVFDGDVYSEMFNVIHPTITLTGGLASVDRDKLVDDAVAAPMPWSIDLGMSRRHAKDEGVFLEKATSVFVTWDKAPDPTDEKWTFDMWHFGIESNQSYGYSFGSSGAGISFGAANSRLHWTSFADPTGQPAAGDPQPINDFYGNLRFGESNSAPIDIEFTKGFALRVSPEWQQIYPRHVFWYWAGSQVIESAASGALSSFVKFIGRRSPSALPIVHFILQNGLAYGFKALRANEMYWPITSEAPMNIYTLNLGVSFKF